MLGTMGRIALVLAFPVTLDHTRAILGRQTVQAVASDLMHKQKDLVHASSVVGESTQH